MAAIQLSFTLRTSPNCKTVHLVGSWDKYAGQLPLSKDSSSSKTGSWKGTFRFQGATLQQGQRYWYYYIMDGHHVSHDPAKPFVTEPTTSRQLNVLDVPAGKSSSSSSSSAAHTSSRHSTSTTHSGRHSSSKTVPQGRPISPSRIVSPRPVNPTAARHINSADYAKQIASLSRQFANTRVDSPPSSSSFSSSSGSDFEEDDTSNDESDSDSVPSLGSSRTSDCSSPRSVSSGSSGSSSCTCERYGITRKGDRVRLDCGGSRCGYSDGDSCSSSDSEGEKHRISEARRHGVVVRGPRH